MGATFDVKFENRKNLNFGELTEGLNKLGFDTFIKYGERLNFKDGSDVIYISEEKMFRLSISWSTLLAYQQPVDWNNPIVKVNTDFLKKWNKIVVSMMKVTGSKVAIALHEALQMCHGFDVGAEALHGIYYEKIEDILPIVRKSIKISFNKNLGNTEVKKIIEKSICIQERIGTINFNFFWCADLPKRTLKNKLLEV